MSQWTHVNASIRYDSIMGFGKPRKRRLEDDKLTMIAKRHSLKNLLTYTETQYRNLYINRPKRNPIDIWKKWENK